MTTGRKPKPTLLHVIEGTHHATKHKSRALEPKPEGRLTDPPDWFSEAQRQVWHEGLRDVPAGLLTAIDASVYRIWCVACDTHRQAAAELAKHGPSGLLTLTGTRPGPPGPDGRPTRTGGNPIQSPLVGVMNRQAVIMLKAAAEMGFTPSSRARVTLDPSSVGSARGGFFDD
jgi:P27 family predicted phage terminase small subunit